MHHQPISYLSDGCPASVRPIRRGSCGNFTVPATSCGLSIGRRMAGELVDHCAGNLTLSHLSSYCANSSSSLGMVMVQFLSRRPSLGFVQRSWTSSGVMIRNRLRGSFLRKSTTTMTSKHWAWSDRASSRKLSRSRRGASPARARRQRMGQRGLASGDRRKMIKK